MKCSFFTCSGQAKALQPLCETEHGLFPSTQVCLCAQLQALPLRAVGARMPALEIAPWAA